MAVAMRKALNETLIERLMRIAYEELSKRLPASYDVDDWQWGDTCFQFVLGYCKGKKYITTDPYRFCYRADEELYGTAEEQLNEWLDRWF